MTDIQWETPAEDGRTHRHGWLDLRPTAAVLKTKPGEWAKIVTVDEPRKAGGISQTIRNGRRGGFRDGTWESVSRTVDGKGVVYARYVGA
jgi:hypothetical protein